jgi:PAS domain S-box-containing protein
LAALYAAAAVLLDLGSGFFVMQTGLAICYPPAGLYLAAILRLGWGALPLAFLNPLFSLLVTLSDQQITWKAVVLLSAASMISPALVLAVSAPAHFPRGRLSTFGGVRAFVLAVCLAVGLESLAAAGAYVASGLAKAADYWPIAMGWWVSVTLPSLTLTPVLLGVFAPAAKPESLPRGRAALWVGLAAVLAPVIMYGSFSLAEAGYTHHLYLAFLPMLLAALSVGFRGAAVAGLLLTGTGLILAPTFLGNAALIVEAQAFLVVVNIAGLLTGAIVDERRRSGTALRESEQLYHTLVEVTGTGFVMIDAEGRVLEANQEYLHLTGRARMEDILGRSVVEWTAPQDRDRNAREVRACLETGKVRHLEISYLRPDGALQPVEINAAVVPIGGERRILSLCFDTRDRKRIEESLRQSEKLQAVGQLAGGIAHDFNNQLTGILGFAELLALQLEQPEQRRYAENILLGARRASDLTRQILAFSRKGKVQVVPVDVHLVIDEVVELLAHSIDKRIRIVVRRMASRPVVEGDPTQLQNALLNLALNARDAMPQGGVLTLETQDANLEEAFCMIQTPPLPVGPYLMVSVVDTGSGMDEETKKRLFEPFFTTKAPGQGTGMGLAAVYGTVRSHRGAITISSEQGRGTTVRIYLPHLPEATVPTPAPLELSPATAARILVVDDEDAVREVAVAMLRTAGHETLAAESGRRALELYRQSWSEIDLVILDLVMPGIPGHHIFRALREINPGARVLLASGYSVEGEAQSLLKEGACAFVQKPFRFAELTTAVAEALRR